LGDKVIIYSVLAYSLIYGFLFTFIGIVVWNFFHTWPENWWTIKFYITMLLIPGIIAVVSTVWFMWGGFKDIKNLFIGLEKRKIDESNNGQILTIKEE
jgi:hypothetical protein